MGRELAGKRAVVTGASGGMGAAVAEGLARAGAKVVLAARTASALANVVGTIQAAGGEAVAVTADVTRSDDRERIVATSRDRFGGLDILVNNAGVGAFGHFATSNEDVMRAVMEVNFFAPVELTRAALPLLRVGVRPCVVNVTSMCGRRGMPAWPEYSASKFALVGMAESQRTEFARFDIDVITIVPGLTASDYSRHLIRNDGKMEIRYDKGMSPAYVAEKVIGAIRSNKREVVLGSEAKWLLRVNRFFPRLTNRLIARKVKKLYA